MNKKLLIFGIHAVHSLLNKNPERVKHLSLLQGREDKKIQSLLQLALAAKVSVVSLTRTELDRLTQNANHQGVVAECYPLKQYTEDDLEAILAQKKQPFFLILDGIQDPHNLGACLRTADAAGVDAVIAPRDKATGITATVSKVASGAVENVPFIQVTNLARTLRFLQENGVWLFGAAADVDKLLYEADLKGAIGIVLGSEGQGMRRLTRDHCDVLLKIPMLGSVSSLNVSVATGVFLFEAVRQRGL